MDQVHVHAAEGIIHLKDSVPDVRPLRDLLRRVTRTVLGIVDVTAQSDVEVP
ncbi:hypothetical protein [Streptomyces sp. NPDC055140]